jgi:ferric-dicitrate binding protein FerR (iron transport regulator)
MNTIPENIDILITAHLNNELNDQDTAQLLTWIEASDEHLAHFHKMAQAHELLYQSGVTETIARPWTTKKTSQRTWWLVAAAATVVGLAVILFLIPSTTDYELATTDVPVQDTLPDGTILSLEKESSIYHQYNEKNQKHEYTLVGQATFDVRSEKALLVRTGPLVIEDIGTVFTVINNPSDSIITIIVQDGKVRCSDQLHPPVLLAVGETANFSKKTNQFIVSKTKTTSPFHFNFTNEKIENVITVLNEYYETEIYYSPEIKDCRINVRFEDEKLSFILAVIASTIDASLIQENSNYKLLGNECH